MVKFSVNVLRMAIAANSSGSDHLLPGEIEWDEKHTSRVGDKATKELITNVSAKRLLNLSITTVRLCSIVYVEAV